MKPRKTHLMNIVTIFLGVSIGATMNAEVFLRKEVIFIFFLGLFAFMISTASGILLAKFMNLFTSNKINPLVGQRVYPPSPWQRVWCRK